MCPHQLPKIFKHEKMGTYTTCIFTRNPLSEHGLEKGSEPLKAGKNLSKLAGPEDSSNEEGW